MDGGRLRLSLLGRFSAEADVPPRPIRISAARHRALLAYLAMRPAYQETRERLATLLWGDRPDQQARQSLRQCLLTLRQEFEEAGVPPLSADRDVVALNPEGIWVDARTLLALAQSDDPARGADELLYGPFLDGLNIDSSGFEEWVRAERIRLEEAAQTVFRRAAAQHDATGDGGKAIALAERLVGIDPLREASQRLLLQLLARHRGPEAALGQARMLQDRLATELDATPEPETLALIQSIRTSVPKPAPIPRAPPAVPTSDDDAAVAAGGAFPPVAAGSPAQRRPTWIVGGMAAAAAIATVLVGYGLSAWTRSDASRPALAAEEQRAAWRPPSILDGRDPSAVAQLYPIVVLPLTAQNAESRDEAALASRLTDDLINDLSRGPAFRVIGRQTAQLYAGRPVDAAAVGMELNVRYVIEGSVGLEEQRLRINLAMIDPRTRLQVWAERFERDRVEQRKALDDIVRSLARHLQVNVFDVEEGRSGPPRARDPAVDELLAKGWNGIIRFFELGTTSGADGYFEEVLRRQPNNRSAMLGLAGYKIGAVGQFLLPEREPHLTQADALLTQVLKVSPRSHMGNYYRGLLHKMRAEPEGALAQFAKVLEMNPSFAPAYANAGHVMSRAGRLDEALEHVRYAIRLSPKDPSLGQWSLFAGEIELERGRDAAALEWLKRAVEIHPRSPFNHAALAAALALKGDHAAAAERAAKLREIAPWLTLDVMLERLTSMSRKGAEPHRLIEGLRKAMPQSPS